MQASFISQKTDLEAHVKNWDDSTKSRLDNYFDGKSENFLDVKIVDDLQSNIKVGSMVEVEIIGIENNHLLAKIL